SCRRPLATWCCHSSTSTRASPRRSASGIVHERAERETAGSRRRGRGAHASSPARLNRSPAGYVQDEGGPTPPERTLPPPPPARRGPGPGRGGGVGKVLWASWTGGG